MQAARTRTFYFRLGLQCLAWGVGLWFASEIVTLTWTWLSRLDVGWAPVASALAWQLEFGLLVAGLLALGLGARLVGLTSHPRGDPLAKAAVPLFVAAAGVAVVLHAAALLGNAPSQHVLWRLFELSYRLFTLMAFVVLYASLRRATGHRDGVGRLVAVAAIFAGAVSGPFNAHEIAFLQGYEATISAPILRFGFALLRAATCLVFVSAVRWCLQGAARSAPRRTHARASSDDPLVWKRVLGGLTQLQAGVIGTTVIAACPLALMFAAERMASVPLMKSTILLGFLLPLAVGLVVLSGLLNLGHIPARTASRRLLHWSLGLAVVSWVGNMVGVGLAVEFTRRTELSLLVAVQDVGTGACLVSWSSLIVLLVAVRRLGRWLHSATSRGWATAALALVVTVGPVYLGLAWMGRHPRGGSVLMGFAPALVVMAGALLAALLLALGRVRSDILAMLGRV